MRNPMCHPAESTEALIAFVVLEGVFIMWLVFWGVGLI